MVAVAPDHKPPAVLESLVVPDPGRGGASAHLLGQVGGRSGSSEAEEPSSGGPLDAAPAVGSSRLLEAFERDAGRRLPRVDGTALPRRECVGDGDRFEVGRVRGGSRAGVPTANIEVATRGFWGSDAAGPPSVPAGRQRETVGRALAL